MDNAQIVDILKLIWPIIVLQLGLHVYALIDLVRRKKVKYITKPVWAIVIIIGEIFGPVIYFILGRSEEE